MAEYIEKAVALSIHEPPKSNRYYQTDNLDDAYGQGWDDALCSIQQIPTADVMLVVHARWIEYQIPSIICCSNCDWATGVEEKNFKYCPNCGACMDGGAD